MPISVLKDVSVDPLKLCLILKSQDIHYHPPAEHHDGNPPRWPHQLQDDVRGNFKKSIRNKEHGQGDVVLRPNQIEIVSHACPSVGYKSANASYYVKHDRAWFI